MGIFAATLVVSWHSHIHMAMVLIPFLIDVYQNDLITEKVIAFWSFTPVILQFLVLAVAAVMALGLIPFIAGFGGLALGLSGMIVDFYIVIQAISLLKKERMLQPI